MDQTTAGEATTSRAVRPAYSAGHFSLEIGGQTAGYLKSIEGGGVKAEVVETQQPGETFANKHITGVLFEEVSIQVDLSLDPLFYQWISDTLKRKKARRDISVVSVDSSYKVRGREDFTNALITEITFPACDGASKEPAYLTVKFAPENVRFTKGDGSKLKGPVTTKKKKWLSSNFRLQIDGLDCSRVTNIAPFTIQQLVAADDIGAGREREKQPVRLEFGDLIISSLETGAQTFMDWQEDFLIKGNCGDEMEKSGTLTYLAPDQSEMGAISFSHLGIFRFALARRDDSSDLPRRVEAGLYVEQVELMVGGQPPA